MESILTYLATGSQVEPVFDGPQFNVHVPIEKLGELGGKQIRNYDKEEQMLLNVSESNLAAMLSKGSIDPNTVAYDQNSGKMSAASEFVSPQMQSWFDPWLMFCGAIAVTAMLLPGISGSYMLTVLGAYAIAISALADFFRDGDFDAIITLCNLGVGIFLGALLFSRVIAYLLKNFHDATMVMLLGFMLGALHTVWPFFNYDYILDPLRLNKGPLLNILGPKSPSLSDPEIYVGILAIIVGFLIVNGLETFSKRGKKLGA